MKKLLKVYVDNSNFSDHNLKNLNIAVVSNEMESSIDQIITIEINGIKYKQKELPPRKPISKTLVALTALSEMANSYGMYGYGMYRNSKHKETPKVNIIKEYELIQQKKSKLSKSQRDWVVCEFEKNYEQLEK